MINVHTTDYNIVVYNTARNSFDNLLSFLQSFAWFILEGTRSMRCVAIFILPGNKIRWKICVSTLNQFSRTTLHFAWANKSYINCSKSFSVRNRAVAYVKWVTCDTRDCRCNSHAWLWLYDDNATKRVVTRPIIHQATAWDDSTE